MKWFVASLGLAATALAVPQAAPDNLKPDGKAPEGCKASFDGPFQIAIYKLGKNKRDIEKRDCAGSNQLLLTLKDSVLKDGQQRTGAIVANYQFQFDGPPQAGSLYTAGWSVCNNGSMALGSATTFYQCLSGDFYNLYDRNWAPQCEPIEIVALGCQGKPGNGQKPGASQIGDGQVQAPTNPPVVSQIGDGQIQAPTNPPIISQISDGQIQAPTRTGAPVTQISDGQVQAPTRTVAPVSQISDGQIQAPTRSVIPVSQISDGQIQAPNKTAISPPITTPTGAAGKNLPQVALALALAGAGALFL